MKACILSVAGPELSPEEAGLFRDQDPWAVILMGRSCVSKTQIRKLVDQIWKTLERPCLIFIDQEGGRVARLKAPEWPVFPPVALYGRLHEKHPAEALQACYLGHFLMGRELSTLGIHADCSPVVDLTIPGAHDIIGDRAFSGSPEIVGMFAEQALKGLSDAGVAGVIKHIPGHGRAKVDSHEALPIVESDREELEADFSAFHFVRSAPMAMTAHILYPEIDRLEPATTSNIVIDDVIRARIGFDGLLMSDDLGMKALGGSLASRTERALEAGCDVALHCSGFLTDPKEILSEMTEVATAAFPLEGVALERAVQAEASAQQAIELDDVDARRNYDALIRLARTDVYG